MSYKSYFYFDIETTSQFPAWFDFKLDDTRGSDLFIRKYELMKKFDSDWNRPIEDVYQDKAPLFPEFGKIICMSFAMFSDDGNRKIMTLIEEDEEILMRRIAKVFIKAIENKRYLCGFNIRNFDLPWIIKKLHKYEIDIPLCLYYVNVKPWEIILTDISEVWKGIGKSGASLDEVAYMLNIPSPKTIMTGDEVHDFYWMKNDRNSIMLHCEQDVNCLTQIAEKLKI